MVNIYKTKKNMSSILKSPPDPRDWIFEDAFPEPYPIPFSYDMTPQLTPIRTQTGSMCVAESCACMKEWQEFRTEKVRMSPEFVYGKRENAATGEDSGMYMRDAMSILFKVGIPTSLTFRSGGEHEVLAEAWLYKIAGYGQVRTTKGMKHALIRTGPCIAVLPFYSYDNTEFWRPAVKNQKQDGYHAVTLVGFNEKGFIVRNSWGKYWGLSGYHILPYNDWNYVEEAWCTIDSGEPPLQFEKPIADDERTILIAILFSSIARCFGESLEGASEIDSDVFRKYCTFAGFKPKRFASLPVKIDVSDFHRIFQSVGDRTVLKLLGQLANCATAKQIGAPDPVTEQEPEPVPVTEQEPEPVPVTEKELEFPGQPVRLYIVTANPFNEDTGENIQLKNYSSERIDISGWKIQEDSAFVFPADTFIEPKEILIVARHDSQVSARFVWGPMALGNSGEDIELLDSSGALMDEVSFGRTVDGSYLVRTGTTSWESKSV